MLESIDTDHPELRPRLSGAQHPLEGIRVVDFSHFIAGPFATMILADMGAEVIKVEAPGGERRLRRTPLDTSRAGPGRSFAWSNRSKKSVALDLKSPMASQWRVT